MFLWYNISMKGTIYKLENKITKEVYIGQSVRYEERLKNHYRNALSYGLAGKLYDSIRKYGRKNFDESILVIIEKEDRNELIEELSELETFYIKKYNSIKNGFNRLESQYVSYGKVAGRKKRKVNQYDLNGEFIKTWDFIRQAATENETSAGHITNCCKYRSPTANGYIWQYEDEVDIERVLNNINKTYLHQARVKRNQRNGIMPKQKAKVVDGFKKEDYLDKW